YIKTIYKTVVIEDKDGNKTEEKVIDEEKSFSILDALKTQEFDMMVIDEVQRVRAPGQAHTEAIYELANEIPGLYDKGRIALLSADPTPNSPNDIVAQLRLLDREVYGQQDTRSLSALLRRINPVRIKNALLDYWLILDFPEEEDWSDQIIMQEAKLSSEEQAVYNAILNDTTLPDKTRLQQLLRCLINPDIFTYKAKGKETQSGVLIKTMEWIEKFLKTNHTVFVIENLYSQGITRECKDRDDVTSFFDKLQSRLGDSVEVIRLDGPVDSDEKKRILREETRNDKQKKVILAKSQIISEGISLAHVNCAIQLGPSYNKPDDNQLYMRFIGEGNTDAQFVVINAVGDRIQAAGTIHEGVEEHAAEKFRITQMLKYGMALIMEDALIADLSEMCQQMDVDEALKSMDIEEAIKLIGKDLASFKVNDRLFIASRLIEISFTPIKRLNAYLAAYHNLGADKSQASMNEHGQLLAELYELVGSKSYHGNNSRFNASLIKELEDNGIITGKKLLDVGCGTLSLENALAELDSNNRDIYNLDLNPFMLEVGERILKKYKPDATPKIKVGNMTDLEKTGFQWGDNSLDVLNCALALHWTRTSYKRLVHLENDEKTNTLLEFNRVLKKGGIMVITLPFRTLRPTEFQLFKEQLHKFFGFEIIEDYTGIGHSTDSTEHNFRNYTVVAKKIGPAKIKGLNHYDLNFSRISTKQLAKVKVKTGKSKPKVARKDIEIETGFLHTLFSIDDQQFQYDPENEISRRREISERDLQERHHKKVIQVRSWLSRMNVEHKGLSNLPDPVQKELDEQGISLINFGTGWVFKVDSNDQTAGERVYIPVTHDDNDEDESDEIDDMEAN
ncbi:methyltransferase domain-containing protein, partial [Patescibacteria group bacterium]